MLPEAQLRLTWPILCQRPPGGRLHAVFRLAWNMTTTLYALLVGIDRYQPPVPPLSGCSNDVEVMENFLRGRAGSARRD